MRKFTQVLTVLGVLVSAVFFAGIPANAGTITQAAGWSWQYGPVMQTTTSSTGQYGMVDFNTSYMNSTATAQTFSDGYTLYCVQAGSTVEVAKGSASTGSGTAQPGSARNTPVGAGPGFTLTCLNDNWYPRRLVVTATFTTPSIPSTKVLEYVFGTTGITGTGTGCSNITTLRASWVNGVLSVYFQDSTPNAAGYDIYFPDPGNNVNAAVTLHVSNATPSNAASGWFGGSVTTSAPSTWTLRVAQTGNAACWLSGTVDQSTTATPDSSSSGSGFTGGTGTDDSTGVSCGLNPFCYVKAAIKAMFVPTDSDFQSWHNQYAGLITHFPANIVVGAGTYLVWLKDLYDCAGYEGTSAPESTLCNGGGTITLRRDTSYIVDDPGIGIATPDSGHIRIDPIGAAGDIMDAHNGIYVLARFVLWLGFFFYVWTRVSRSLGSKEETAATE